MPEGVLATTIIEILGDSKKLIAEMKKAEEEGRAFSARMGGMFSSLLKIALPIGLGAGLLEIGKNAIESAAHVDLLSQQVGISVENLSQLDYAGRTVGLSIDDMSKAFGVLSKQMVKGQDDVGKASKVLKNLGISARDEKNNLKDTYVVLGEIADKFKDMPDGPMKTAYAMEALGKGGKAMIPFLNLGREGIEKLRREADAAGYTLSEFAAKQAHEFEVSLQKIEMAGVGVARTTIAELIPAVEAVSHVLGGDYTNATDKATEHTYGFRDALHQIANGAIVVTAGLEDLVQDLHLVAHLAFPKFGENAVAEWQQAMDEIERRRTEALAKMNRHGASGSWGTQADDPEEAAKVKKERMVFEAFLHASQMRILQATQTGAELERAQAEENFANAKQLAADKFSDEDQLAKALTQLEEEKNDKLLHIDKKYHLDYEREAHSSQMRILQATLTGAALERSQAQETYQEAARLAQEKYKGAKELSAILLQLEQEKNDKLSHINRKYHLDYEKDAHASQMRILQATLTGANLERSQIEEAYQESVRLAQEKYKGARDLANILTDLETEKNDKLLHVNKKYHDEELALAHATQVKMLQVGLTGFKLEQAQEEERYANELRLTHEKYKGTAQDLAAMMRLREEHLQIVAHMEDKYVREGEAANHASQMRLLQSTLTGAALERAQAQETLQEELRLAHEKFKGTTEEASVIEQIWAEHYGKMRSIDLKYANSFGDMLDRLLAEHTKVSDQLVGLTQQAAHDMQSALGTGFFDILTGKFNDLQNVAKNFFKAMLQHIADFLADQAVISLLKMLKSLAMSYGSTGTISFGQGLGSVAGAAPGVIGAANGGIFAGGTGITAFATGGIVTSPTIGLVGEGAYNETVVPLPNGRSIPVEMQGGGGRQIIENHVTMMLANDFLPGMASRIRPMVQPSRGEVIAHVGADFWDNGFVRHIIRNEG